MSEYKDLYYKATGKKLEEQTARAFNQHYLLNKYLLNNGYDESLSLTAWHAGLDLVSLHKLFDDANREGYSVAEYIKNMPRVREMPLVAANIIDIDEEN
jgi:hypothetical protein